MSMALQVTDLTVRQRIIFEYERHGDVPRPLVLETKILRDQPHPRTYLRR